jgi:hypothetical protein
MSSPTLNSALDAFKACSTFDLVVIGYAVCITLIIISFRRSEHRHEKAKGKKYHFKRPNAAAPAAANTPLDPQWKKQFEGVWLQYREENFDEFLKFSGTSFALRKVIPVAFFMTRHTLSVTTRVRQSLNGEEESDEYFTVKRDFGEGVREWTLSMKMGADQESAEEVRAVIDTDEEYVFQNWADEAARSICTLSTPVLPRAGVRCLQTRTLLDPDQIRMVSD